MIFKILNKNDGSLYVHTFLTLPLGMARMGKSKLQYFRIVLSWWWSWSTLYMYEVRTDILRVFAGSRSTRLSFPTRSVGIITYVYLTALTRIPINYCIIPFAVSLRTVVSHSYTCLHSYTYIHDSLYTNKLSARQIITIIKKKSNIIITSTILLLGSRRRRWVERYTHSTYIIMYS